MNAKDLQNFPLEIYERDYEGLREYIKKNYVYKPKGFYRDYIDTKEVLDFLSYITGKEIDTKKDMFTFSLTDPKNPDKFIEGYELFHCTLSGLVRKLIKMPVPYSLFTSLNDITPGVKLLGKNVQRKET